MKAETKIEELVNLITLADSNTTLASTLLDYVLIAPQETMQYWPDTQGTKPDWESQIRDAEHARDALLSALDYITRFITTARS